MTRNQPDLSTELQQNCSADSVCHMPAKDRNIDRHAPGWKRPSRGRPELTFDPEHLQASFLITRHAMCAWVGVSIPAAELWAKNGTGPRITRFPPDEDPLLPGVRHLGFSPQARSGYSQGGTASVSALTTNIVKVPSAPPAPFTGSTGGALLCPEYTRRKARQIVAHLKHRRVAADKHGALK